MRLLALLLLVACAGEPRPARPWDAARHVDAATAFAPPKARALYSALAGPTTGQFGAYREIAARGPHCQWAGATPVVLPRGAAPRAGRPVKVDWALDYIPPPSKTTDANGEEQPRTVSLLVSFRNLQEPIAIAPACWLLVHPDIVLVPDGNLLRYDTGRGSVHLNWTPDLAFVGTSVFVQLLVAIPEANAIGHVTSRGLEILIGSP